MNASVHPGWHSAKEQSKTVDRCWQAAHCFKPSAWCLLELILFWGGIQAMIRCRSLLITRHSRNQGSELSSATVVPQDGVVADITRGEDELYLIPGNAVGTATPALAGMDSS